MLYAALLQERHLAEWTALKTMQVEGGGEVHLVTPPPMAGPDRLCGLFLLASAPLLGIFNPPLHFLV